MADFPSKNTILQGTLNGTPTSGTLNLSSLTLTLPTANKGQVVVFASRNTDFSVPSGSTQNTFVFNAETIDTASAYNTSTGEFTVPVTGTYLVETSIFWVAGTAAITMALYVSGTRVKQLTQQTQTAQILISHTSVLSLTAAQVLTYRISQDQGSNRTVGGYGDTYTFWKITRLA